MATVVNTHDLQVLWKLQPLFVLHCIFVTFISFLPAKSQLFLKADACQNSYQKLGITINI